MGLRSSRSDLVRSRYSQSGHASRSLATNARPEFSVVRAHLMLSTIALQDFGTTFVRVLLSWAANPRGRYAPADTTGVMLFASPADQRRSIRTGVYCPSSEILGRKAA